MKKYLKNVDIFVPPNLPKSTWIEEKLCRKINIRFQQYRNHGLTRYYLETFNQISNHFNDEFSFIEISL